MAVMGMDQLVSDMLVEEQIFTVPKLNIIEPLISNILFLQ